MRSHPILPDMLEVDAPLCDKHGRGAGIATEKEPPGQTDSFLDLMLHYFLFSSINLKYYLDSCLFDFTAHYMLNKCVPQPPRKLWRERLKITPTQSRHSSL